MPTAIETATTGAEFELLKELVRSRGYWILQVYPTTYREGLIPRSKLETIIRESAVHRRNWGDYPYTDYYPFLQGDDWVGGGARYDLIRHVWKLFQSGLWRMEVGLIDDWQDESRILPPDSTWAPQKRLGIMRTVTQASYALEFASRYGAELLPYAVGTVNVELTIQRLAGRTLQVDVPGRIPFLVEYRTDAERWTFRWSGQVEELIAEWSTLALKGAKEVFERFGWNPSMTFLGDIQREWYQ